MRQRLALRLEGYPLLRTLVLDRAFFWAFFGLVGTIATIAVSVPRVWQTTPEGFPRARITVSLIDLVQAWSLSRAAGRAAAAGRYDEAIQASRSALANNLGDPRLHRASLLLLRDMPMGRPEDTVLGLFGGSWLLALTHTNAADLELVLDVLEKHRLSAYALEILGPPPADESPAQQAARARSLITAGRAEEFAALWRTRRATWESDPRQRLYHDAWLAGWDSGTPAIEAMLRLKAASAAEGNPGLTAARLLFLAAVRRGGADDVALALNRLETADSAGVSLHIAYWRFLASAGRFREAQVLAENYGKRPQLAHDAADYAAALMSLGLRTAAIEYLEQHLPRYETHPAVWEVYFAALIDERRWNEVRRAAATARLQSASFETARILALFAEYRAEMSENRRQGADRLAGELAAARIVDNATALAIARELVRDRREGAALKLLLAKRGELREREEFWAVVFNAAIAVKDVPALQESTLEMLRLAPDKPAVLSNRAAMLLAIEDRPAEALEITLRLVTEHPGSAPFQINHAFALLLNRRVDEAWAILRRIRPEGLERQAASAYHLAAAEAEYARGHYTNALAEAEKVATGLLLPPQAARLERLRRELRSRING